MNDDCHAAFSQTFNWLTLHTDAVHMVEILNLAHGGLRKSSTSSWIRKCEEVGVYISKTTGWM